MWYSENITVPASTSESDNNTQTLKVWRGVIHHIRIYFPPGCHNLAHVRILHGIHPIAPSNGDQSLTGNGSGPDYKEFYPLFSESNKITIHTWNEDTAWPHTITVEIGILPEWVLTSYRVIDTLSTALKKFVALITGVKLEG